MDPVKPYVTFPDVSVFDPNLVYVSDSDKEANKGNVVGAASQGSRSTAESQAQTAEPNMAIDDLEDGELDEEKEIGSPPVSQELPFVDPNPLQPQRLGHDSPYRELPRPSPGKLFGDRMDENVPDYVDVVEETDEEVQSESDEDSDDACVKNKRARFGADIPPPNFPASSAARPELHLSELEYDAPYPGFEDLARELQSKRSNNVWVNVWESENLQAAANKLENVTLSSNQGAKVIERGPESFTVNMDMKETRHNNRKRRLMKSSEDPSPPVEDPNFSLSSDDSSSESNLANATAPNVKHKPKLKDFLQTLSPEELKAYIVKTLCEQNEQLIENTIHLLGKQVAINLLSDTIKVQRRGGMLVYSGARKRTPGGVFIYLLRQNKLLDQEIVEKIVGQNSVPVEQRPKRLGSRQRPKRGTPKPQPGEGNESSENDS